MSCSEASAALAAWDPASDLDEAVAVHVGACPGCRATFDARFPPAVGRPVAVAPARTAPAPARWAPVAALAAVAAIAAGVTAGGLWSRADAGDDPLPPECPLELVAVAMECPPS